MFRQTERPLTSAERDDVAARMRTLGEVLDRKRREERRNRVELTWMMVALVAAFAALAAWNIATGHRAAALAAGAGVVVFAAFSMFAVRPIPMVTEESQLAELEQTLATGRVRVFEIDADAAFVLGEQSGADDGRQVAADPFGYVLRVDHDRYVYVRVETCAGVDPGQLPNTRLVIERMVPLGVWRAEVHGTVIVPALQISPITREHADRVLIIDLAAFEAPWDELPHRLSAPG